MMPGRMLGRDLDEHDRKLALRIATVFAIPMALIMVIPLIGAGLLYTKIAQDRINDTKERIAATEQLTEQNRKLIKRVEQERIERTQAINDFVYSQCLQSEVRDVVIVEQLKAARRRAVASLPPGPLRRDQVEAITDGIVALEPPFEMDCTPPPATAP